MKPQEHIQTNLKVALQAAGFDTSDHRLLSLEKPKQADHGDVSSPVAMNLTKIAKKAPRVIAQDIINHFEIDPFYIEKIDIAGPGFINFYLSKSCLQQSVKDIVEEGESFGESTVGQKQQIQLEFVSANPTGPLNVVSARAASVGDVLTNLFCTVGYDARREFYVNDAGRQIRLLGASLSARYMTELGEEQSIPEDGYHGEYLRDLAKTIIEKKGDTYKEMPDAERHTAFSKTALEYMLRRHRDSMDAFGVNYETWFRESAIRERNAHIQILDKLKSNGFTYEQDGAVWFRSTDFDDEKDRVLLTSEGEPTYFLVDIAYHEDKFARGFEKVIDFWGPDHHGYIARMSAALQALGHPREQFHVSIIQQVNLLRGGEQVKMSKRAGEIIEMDELIEEVGVDAARYFFADRRISQPLDFDIDLAKSQSDENPVYYVQYAHARICNVLRFATESGVIIPEQGDTSALTEPLELAVINKLLDFPETLVKAAEFLEPHRLTNYLHETATVFHRFYHDHRVVTEDEQATESRLMLCKATRQVLANGLKLLGISSPESM